MCRNPQNPHRPLLSIESTTRTECDDEVHRQTCPPSHRCRVNDFCARTKLSSHLVEHLLLRMSFVAENERSQDADVTGRVSAIWKHFSKFGNVSECDSLRSIVSKLAADEVSPDQQTGCHSHFCLQKRLIYTAVFIP